MAVVNLVSEPAARLGANPAKTFCKGFVQSQAGGLRERGGLGIAEDFDRLFRRVHHDAAILALYEVLFDRRAQNGIERLVQVIRKFTDDFFALHEFPPRPKN